jgi:hypothetical protein
MPTRSRSAAVLVTALLVIPAAGLGARAQQVGYGQTINSPQQQRELDPGSGGSGSGGSIFDATNPLELMNRIRRATSLDNATPPGDAIDAALRDFEEASQPVPASPGSSLMPAP